MPAKRYPVILDPEQRDYLLDLITSGTESARKLTRGRILLKADEGELGPAYADKEIKEALEVSIPTIERTRKTFALEGTDPRTDASKAFRSLKTEKVGWRKRGTSDRFSLFRSTGRTREMDAAPLGRKNGRVEPCFKRLS